MGFRSFYVAETRYFYIKCKCLAVMYRFEKFEIYLMGRRTLVNNDQPDIHEERR